ncbi:sugar-binding protein [Thalassotalea sp. HSM 43]|uniref:sugar-binding protein n=1 Tax=Thalassotalea sp. HSM 43 TaxID=2552945 RepID=UPI001080021C|nr:sugar-binding protein [Thalassotalea sp. HSM 43]QBY03247.1 sugar-binding protein [Thalassotalea sp. HSM 43]
MLRAIVLVLLMTISWQSLSWQKPEKQSFTAPYSEQAININADADDPVWQQGQWYPLDQDMIGNYPKSDDFSGRFKVAWDEKYVYLLVEMSDDVLFDQYADPLFFYWDDDALEVFIDEDASGGSHTFDYNAFAYHIALDNQAIDIGGQLENGEPEFLALNSHVKSQWRRDDKRPNGIIWEVALEIHNDSFDHNKPLDKWQTSRVTLQEGKVLGFMLAYCDNDGSKVREHFLGSTTITPIAGDKNLGYKTADVFSRLTLVKGN